jgi:signal transduction histidine kinase
LNLQKEKAEASSKAKTDFLSTMSHEIRTPMSGIMGLIEILKDEKDEEEIRKYLDMLEISSKNLLTLISDILDINKIEAGSFRLSESEFILKDEIERILDLNRPVFIDKGLYLELDQSELEDYKVLSDSGKLNQIWEFN